MKTQRLPFGELLILVGGIITALLYAVSKDGSFPAGPVMISQAAAVEGAYLLSVTMVLSSKWPGLDGAFGGLDQVYRIHHIIGAIAYGLLAQHLVWLVVNQIPNYTLVSAYWLPALNQPALSFGIAAFWLLSLLLVVTLFVQLPYHAWHTIHQWFGLVALLGLLHVYLIHSDVSRFAPLRFWLLGWLGLGLAGSLYIRFLYRLIGPRIRCKIERVTEAAGVLTLQLAPVNKRLKFTPGQFVFMETNLTHEQHPFTISSPPSDTLIELRTKIVGDYTLQLKKIERDETVNLYGPYGAFLGRIKESSKIVCVAGGIGITPFLSLMNEWGVKQNLLAQAVLIHSVKNSEQAISLQKLTQLEEHLPGFSYLLHQSSLEGRLSGAKIQQLLALKFTPDAYYLSAPLPMMLALRDQLAATGVPYKKIMFEDFSLI